jgi:hypothetical protein
MPAWDELAGSLPTHQAEVMAAHQGAPSVAVQDATHGVPAPAEDRGTDDGQKYGPGGIC